MTSIKASVENVHKPLVAQLHDRQYTFKLTHQTAVISDSIKKNFGHNVIMLNSRVADISTKKPIVHDIDLDFFDKLSPGDILQIMPDGSVNLLWGKKQTPNDFTLFVTNQCNANCLTCPQPPFKDEYSLLSTNKFIVKSLKDEKIIKIGITGGEPTVKSSDLIELLKDCFRFHPNATVDLLTNGKNLADFDLCKKIALSHPNITFCISFPSDIESDFNRAMGQKLYSQTMKSIQNLAKLRQNIELRVVITSLNFARLSDISEFIYRNFPFVQHIAFMGMEITGMAQDNFKLLDFDLENLSSEIHKAVYFLNRTNLKVSIYNIPFCVIGQKVWPFVRNSISKWKQNYLVECNLCSKKSECPGLFTTSSINQYVKISPIRL